MHDSQVANDLIEVIQEAQYFIADKGYDSQEIRDKAIEHGMKAIIPKRKNAKQPNTDFDSYLYKLRHLVENAFARLKQFRSIATRHGAPVRRNRGNVPHGVAELILTVRFIQFSFYPLV